MSLTPALALLSIQGVLGAYDNFRNHEFREGLSLRSRQRTELALHATREGFYCILFPTMAWLEWRGWFAWLLMAVIVAEVAVTCWDFIEEDRTRRLSGNERLVHTVLTLNYGAFLALLIPELATWAQAPAGIAVVDRGGWSWLMTIYSAGVLLFGIREASAAWKFWRHPTNPAAATPHRNCLEGLPVAPELAELHRENRLRRVKGDAEVQLGSPLASLALRAIGIDLVQGAQSITVTFEPDGDGELWHRSFTTGRFTTRFERNPASSRGLIEYFGPLAFSYELAVLEHGIVWHLHRVKLFGVSLPAFLMPKIVASEGLNQRREYEMQATIQLPILGHLLGYHCTLWRCA